MKLKNDVSVRLQLLTNTVTSAVKMKWSIGYLSTK